MKKLFFILSLLFSLSVSAQVGFNKNPFVSLRPPTSNLKASLLFSKNEVSIWRFSLPFAGFDIRTQQISTGLAYGFNRMHFIDSTQKYYTDLSLFLAILLNGNIAPTPYNFTSIGLGVGILNGLVNIIPCYSIGDKIIGFKISFGLTLK